MIDSRDEMSLGDKIGADKAAKTIPLASRIAHEIPRPLDGQQFQRNCVYLYRAELKDPNTQEYGRNGQNQHGIDIIGRRDANPDYLVGIQCRKIDKPLKKADILKDCRAALKLEAKLKEIIFATTAEDDAKATDAAFAVESELRAEGHHITVALYGWRSLCLRIAEHDTAYNVFFPWAAANRAQVTTTETPQQELAGLATQLAEAAERITRAAAAFHVTDQGHQQAEAGEDVALHARIDVYRDLLKNDRELLIAKRELQLLRPTIDAKAQPRAEFRILTNLGAVELNLGNDEAASKLFEEAYALRESDPKAIANLALARLIQGKANEAFPLAQRAVELEPDAFAVGYLLQAAGRGDWHGDPESLIPESAKGGPAADLGLAEFYRIKDIEGWQAKVIELASKHPDDSQFKRVKALARLSLAADHQTYLTGGFAHVSVEELDEAATILKENVLLQLDFADIGYPDLWTSTNNAALALRLSNRFAEAEDIIQKTLLVRPDASELFNLLGLVQALQGKREEAIETLRRASIENGEAAVLLVELISEADMAEALRTAQGIDAAKLPERMRREFRRMEAELALRNNDDAAFEAAISHLETLGPGDPSIGLLRVDKKIAEGASNEDVSDDLQQIADSAPGDMEIPARVLLAEQFLRLDQPLAASKLLDGQVDLSRFSLAAVTYLRALGASRRDTALEVALSQASERVLNHPDVLWLRGSHAWNAGDLDKALEAIQKLSVLKPKSLQIQVFLLEIYGRRNDAASLLAALEAPLEQLPNADLKQLLRLAAILSHFGFRARAAALAYRIFLGHRDESRAWMVLSSVILRMDGEPAPAEWNLQIAAPDIAVDMMMSDGSKVFFVIEPSVDLRKLDSDSWEPGHEFCQAVIGKGVGDLITLPEGRSAKIEVIRHKYVARLHFIMQNYERRFPTIFGFRQIEVDPSKPDGLESIKKELRDRDEWLRAEVQEYADKSWPLTVLAFRIGADSIDAAGSILAYGRQQKVAQGNEAERDAGVQTVIGSGRRGCVLDLWTLWTAWRLKVLDVVQEVLGSISVSQGLVDTLRLRRETIAQSELNGLKSMKWAGEGIALSEAEPNEVKKWGQDVDEAISWIEANATICPIKASDRLPQPLVSFLAEGKRTFDEVILAIEHQLVLVSDDLPMRQIALTLGVQDAVWLHMILLAAAQEKKMDDRRYVQSAAQLIDSGQFYIGVNGFAVAEALSIDLEGDISAPGPYFKALLKTLGGATGDMQSHIVVAEHFLQAAWQQKKFEKVRAPATGLLLEALLKGRANDYRQIFATVVRYSPSVPELQYYLAQWGQGHFVYTPTSVKEPSRQQRRAVARRQ